MGSIQDAINSLRGVYDGQARLILDEIKFDELVTPEARQEISDAIALWLKSQADLGVAKVELIGGAISQSQYESKASTVKHRLSQVLSKIERHKIKAQQAAIDALLAAVGKMLGIIIKSAVVAVA